MDFVSLRLMEFGGSSASRKGRFLMIFLSGLIHAALILFLVAMSRICWNSAFNAALLSVMVFKLFSKLLISFCGKQGGISFSLAKKFNIVRTHFSHFPQLLFVRSPSQQTRRFLHPVCQSEMTFTFSVLLWLAPSCIIWKDFELSKGSVIGFDPHGMMRLSYGSELPMRQVPALCFRLLSVAASAQAKASSHFAFDISR